MLIGWATNVNKEVLDSTNVKVGENATIKDSTESGGQKKTRVTCANPPDVFSVSMDFDCVTKGYDAVDPSTHEIIHVDDGLTEYERFMAWYKWKHCYGANPFEFPAILINSNRQQGMSQDELEHILRRIENHDPTAKLPDNEYYVITSAVDGSKSGLCQRVNMTWETFATQPLLIEDEESEVDEILAENGYVDIVLTSTPDTEPTKNTWELKIDNVTTEVITAIFDGNVTVRYYFEPLTTVGVHVASIGEETDSFEVE